MEFKEFKEEFQENFKKITKDVDHLFVFDVDKDDLWDLYLDSFPPGTNEILRERREFDCSACRHFIKQYGNIATIKDGLVRSIWSFQTDDPKYNAVLEELAFYVMNFPIKGVYVGKEQKIGVDKNYEADGNNVREWHHFYLELPDKFVYKGRETVDTVKGEYRAAKDVFKRSLDELSLDSVETVLELIGQNSLYKGEEWKKPLGIFRRHQKAYNKIDGERERDDYAWENSLKIGPAISKIRNHSIGTLLIDITDGMDLDKAVKRYEKIVAPTNYKRPKPIFSKRMIEKAKETVTELGYKDSLPRRFATLDDITVNNIIFSNRDSAKRISDDVFEELEQEVAVNPKHFSKVEEIPIKEFIENVIPTADEIEVYLENKHAKNMVSLIAPIDKEAPSMFKWGNPFSWGYSGNITDSTMKENVKMAGGNVEGILRFSIQWNEDGKDNNDLDAHCIEPGGNRIFFNNMNNPKTGGVLDIDITQPNRQRPGKPAVENITWPYKERMEEGVYKFLVHQYAHRGGRNGFRAEIEFNGQIYEFNYPKELRQGEKVPVAEVTLKDGVFTIEEKIPSQLAVRDIWNVKTNQFIPVSVVMYSPNYWDEQEGIGHKHVFFMLKDCINDEMPNGFYNEFLKQELVKHKHVFEALGSKMKVEDVDDQLSGVGFSTTKRGEVLVKITGQSERILKVKF